VQIIASRKPKDGTKRNTVTQGNHHARDEKDRADDKTQSRFRFGEACDNRKEKEHLNGEDRCWRHLWESTGPVLGMNEVPRMLLVVARRIRSRVACVF